VGGGGGGANKGGLANWLREGGARPQGGRKQAQQGVTRLSLWCNRLLFFLYFTSGGTQRNAVAALPPTRRYDWDFYPRWNGVPTPPNRKGAAARRKGDPMVRLK